MQILFNISWVLFSRLPVFPYAQYLHLSTDKSYLSEQLISDVLEVVHHDAHEDIIEDERANQDPQNHVEVGQPSSARLSHLLRYVQPVVQGEDLKQRRHRRPHVAEPVPVARLFPFQLVGRPPEDNDAEDGEDVEEDA